MVFKPYQSIQYFGKYLLVAHRNILSVFDTNKEQWVHHEPFEFDVSQKQVSQVSNQGLSL